MQSERQWDATLKKVQFDLNSTVNKTTMRTPYEIIHGFTPKLEHAKVANIVPIPWTSPDKNFEETRQKIIEEQQKYKSRFDEKRYEGVKYDVGEVVVVKGSTESTGESAKLQNRYKGPYVVVEELAGDTYRIKRLEAGRKQLTTAHVSQLKGYYNPIENEVNTSDEEQDLDELLLEGETGYQDQTEDINMNIDMELDNDSPEEEVIIENSRAQRRREKRRCDCKTM